jgi:hypothetical protein
MSLDTCSPEYLDDYADRLAQGGFAADAAHMRQIATAWREDQRALADTQAENSRMARVVIATRTAVSSTLHSLRTLEAAA